MNHAKLEELALKEAELLARKEHLAEQLILAQQHYMTLRYGAERAANAGQLRGVGRDFVQRLRGDAAALLEDLERNAPDAGILPFLRELVDAQAKVSRLDTASALATARYNSHTALVTKVKTYASALNGSSSRPLPTMV